jgi:hypothetical protein
VLTVQEITLLKHESQNYSPDTNSIIKYPSTKENRGKRSDWLTVFLRMIHYQARQHCRFLLQTTHDFIMHVILQYPFSLYLNVYKTAREGVPKFDTHMKPDAVFKTSKKN